MGPADTKDIIWAGGEAYEDFVGRWSRLVAPEFVKWLNVKPNLRWLDVGCGTGVLTQAILENASPSSVVGIDPTEQFLDYAREHVQDSRVTFRTGDALALQTDRGTIEAVVSGLVLQLFDKPERMIAEMARACRLSGRVATYVWDYSGGMEMMRYFWDVADEFDPAAREADTKNRFANMTLPNLWNLFLDAGLNDVTTRAIQVPTVFRDFDDYWNPFLVKQGTIPAYVMSLSEDKRAALRERVRAKLPIERDGSIHLTAQVLAVRGTR
jgi:SAM-dependent methyltransferase